MATDKIKPKTIEEYIDLAPEATKERLWQMHECILSAAPGAEQGLKWGMPAYSYSRILVTFAVFKNHIGFYPTPSAILKFAKDLAKYHKAESSVQFPHDKPLPLTLIKKITRFRVKESQQNDAKWKQ
ncbi:MAG TPA: DUF1801 domain-containing protein [Panacibacter sp.]|nr:DUF1801 domain-containing protein [Panacibacter sp.]HNP43469.1 DUF1801 domain-containing protein [Panacibacter sp.]